MRKPDDATLLRAWRGGDVMNVAPPHAQGPCQILDNGEQLYLDENVAYLLAFSGFIYYSPWDGPNAKVYCLCEGVTLDAVKAALA